MLSIINIFPFIFFFFPHSYIFSGYKVNCPLENCPPVNCPRTNCPLEDCPSVNCPPLKLPLGRLPPGELPPPPIKIGLIFPNCFLKNSPKMSLQRIWEQLFYACSQLVTTNFVMELCARIDSCTKTWNSFGLKHRWLFCLTYPPQH